MTLTARGRTWAALTGVATLGVIALTVPTTPDPRTHGDTSLAATVERYVDAFNAHDWTGLAQVVQPSCRAEAEAQAADMATGLLRDATARIISVDTDHHAATLGVVWPAQGPEEHSVTSTWVWDGHAWLVSDQTCGGVAA